jgi:hypothetical protein
MLVNIFCRPSFPAALQSPINAGAFTMIAGMLIVPVISFVTPKPDSKLVEKCFSCYEQSVAVKVKESLGG